MIWLVVYLPLWNIWVRQLGFSEIPNWMGKNMFQSPPTRWSTEMIMVKFQHQCAMLIFSWPLEGLILWRKSGPLPKYMMFLLMGMVPIVYKTPMGNMINMLFLIYIYNYNNDIFRKQTIIFQYQTQSQHTRRRKFWKIIFTNHLPTVSTVIPFTKHSHEAVRMTEF